MKSKKSLLKEIEDTKSLLNDERNKYNELLLKHEKTMKDCVEYLKQITKLTEENKVYKAYYGTESEVSDDVKAKVFTDIKVMELRESNKELRELLLIQLSPKMFIQSSPLMRL